jgi:hypothetical protein
VLDFSLTAHADSEISLAINKLIEEAARNVIDEPRDYLGASAVGHVCARRVQYDWQCEPEHAVRLRDIFARGHFHEKQARAHLRRAKFRFAARRCLGFRVLGGLFRGNADGILLGGPKSSGLKFPALWEHKALNAKGWRSVNKHGLKDYPQYAAQVALYQAYLKLIDNPALFTVTNADTCERVHILIPFDSALAQQSSDRALMIIEATRVGELLPRFTDNKEDWRCNVCAHRERCWEWSEQSSQKSVESSASCCVS